MNPEELLSRVALAFGIGLLIGLERGWHKRDARPGARAAGVRTFALTGMLGGIVAAIVQDEGGHLRVSGSILLGASFVAYAAVITLFGRDENRINGTFSATTTIAALLTFMLGAYALIGDVRIAAACAVTAAGILMIRETLHAWVARITPAEIQSALVLLAMTFIALPVVPDRVVDSLAGINPRTVWLIAIMLAAISFVGYIAVRSLGERRGVLIAAAAAGIISSTAVTLASARRVAAGEGSPRVLAAGVTLAMAVSFVRVAVIIVVLKPSSAPMIIPALLVSAVVAAGYAMLSVLRQAKSVEPSLAVRFGNPFGFWSVLGMAFSIGVLIVAGQLIYARFGATGAIAGAAAMGLFDADAMAVSMLRLTPDEVDADTMAYAILTGVAANTFTKVAIGALIARGVFAAQITIVCVACVLAGWLTMLATMALVR